MQELVTRFKSLLVVIIKAGMEHFRHIGEVVGSLKALMVLRDEIQINPRQCGLIIDIFSLAFETIADDIRQNLKLEERNTKWKALEFPLRELCRVFKEGELYIRHCLDSKDWWGKAITFSQNNDCVEFHIHNLLCYFPAVIEAIENAGEISGLDQDEKDKKKLILSRKYDMEWNDPKLFQWRFSKQYLVSRDICKQLENAWREDRWRLIEALKEKRTSNKDTLTKNELHLADMLLKKLLHGSEKMNIQLCPISVLLGAKDYQVRRRLGRGRDFKEIQWLGQSFALRHFAGEMRTYQAEISTLLSLSHPNILQYLCGFYDDEKREISVVMELMNKDLWTYMKENCGPRRQILFSIPVVVDLMLQMGRGIEYLHSKKIYHGDLNPYNVLLRPRNCQEGYFQAKVSGFGLTCVKNIETTQRSTRTPSNEEFNPFIWYAPEVLTELEQTGNTSKSSKYSEKADAYSFGMICFELLTGKVPFEDSHLQGDRTNQKIKEGERPLFPHRSPKYLVSLIKKCWQNNPSQRPTFSSICRILRYIKKLLSMNTEFHVINPELNQLELLSPHVDCCDIEAMFLKNFPMDRPSILSPVSQIPYEMFAYKVVEKGKIISNNSNAKDNKYIETEMDESTIMSSEENNEQNKVCGDDNASIAEEMLQDPLPLITTPKSNCEDRKLVCSNLPSKKSVKVKKPTLDKAKKDKGIPKLQATRSLPPSLHDRSLRVNRVSSSLTLNTLSPSRRMASNVSESLKINKPSVSTPSSPGRRKTTYEVKVFDSMSSSKLKQNLSPLSKYDNITASNGLKMKRSQKTLNPSLSPARVRCTSIVPSLKVQKGIMLGTFTSRKNGYVSDLDKTTRGRLSPLALSPLSPYLTRGRKYGHFSDYESMYKTNRQNLSRLVLRPLSGHVSD
ncbi:putative protein kinase TKL-Gdt family [Lupinus albus]|uniref:Protein kinase domain-containing protein n=1 Tax=Lupinus albus TaxID=3870 RepID=A0A6A4QH30_LUPAL|nr:putative protein kinase TKL-Gdt family [Lupinus albus]